jgi:hypothetical protein
MHLPDVSNTIRFDALLVQYLARELNDRLRARRLRGVRLDTGARRLVLELESERLVWELHPARGWIRRLPPPAEDPVREAAEGWAGRRIPTQRRPRVRRVAAPPDERWIELEIDAGGADRASRFVIELMTNQWNVLALSPGGVILAALHTRVAGGRPLQPGARYLPPDAGPGPRREGVAEPLALERWRALLGDLPPADRLRALVRAVAWTSPLNAGAILGDAARPGSGPGHEVAAVDAAWHRYAALAGLPPAQPTLLQLDRPTPYPLPLPAVEGTGFTSLVEAMEAAAGGAGGAPNLAPEVQALLERRLHRAERLVERLRDEARAAPAEADRLRLQADLLMAQLHRVPRGSREVELDDFQGSTLSVELDPALSPVDNAAAFYDRARKRERAAHRLPDRIRLAEAERDRLAGVIAALEEGSADPAEAARHLEAARPAAGRDADDEARLPYRRYRSSGGLEIRVGRTGRANDDLTFRHSAPDDIWLHARDAAGAHVILRWNDRAQNPPRRDLEEAAVLAALHSRARTSGTVPVDWTRRKHVRKPRKAAPGAVLPDRVATLFVEPDPDLPARLEPEP